MGARAVVAQRLLQTNLESLTGSEMAEQQEVLCNETSYCSCNDAFADGGPGRM